MNDSSVTQSQDAAEMQMQDPNLVIPTSLHQPRVNLYLVNMKTILCQFSGLFLPALGVKKIVHPMF